MSADFLDSNVLIYLFSSDTAKATRAETLLEAGGVISVQVLNEIANVARRKMRLDWRETRAIVESLAGLLTVMPLDIETHAGGLALAERYGLSVYDGMIVSAALQAACPVLYSEDMQDGLRIGRTLEIRNPFAAPSPSAHPFRTRCATPPR